jgi:GNAT superfamily N-acetyltransferase
VSEKFITRDPGHIVFSDDDAASGTATFLEPDPDARGKFRVLAADGTVLNDGLTRDQAEELILNAVPIDTSPRHEEEPTKASPSVKVSEEDVTARLVTSAEPPPSRELSTRVQGNVDLLPDLVGDVYGIDVGRIEEGVTGHVSKRTRTPAEDAEIVAKMADHGKILEGKVYRGLAFRELAEAEAFLKQAVGGGFLRTKDAGTPESFATSPEVAEEFASRLARQVTGPGRRNAHGVVLEVRASGPRGQLRGFPLQGYGEAEAVLPRGQAYAVESVVREVDADGWVTYRVKASDAKPKPDEFGRHLLSTGELSREVSEDRIEIGHHVPKTLDIGGKQVSVPGPRSHVSASVNHRDRKVVLAGLHVDEALRGRGRPRGLVAQVARTAFDLGYGLSTTGVFSEGGRATIEGLVRRGFGTHNEDGTFSLDPKALAALVADSEKVK